MSYLQNIDSKGVTKFFPMYVTVFGVRREFLCLCSSDDCASTKGNYLQIIGRRWKTRAGRAIPLCDSDGLFGAAWELTKYSCPLCSCFMVTFPSMPVTMQIALRFRKIRYDFGG